MSSETNAQKPPAVSQRRLWYGTIGVASVWFFIEMADVALAWEACWGGLSGSRVLRPPGLRILLGIITFISLGATIAAGTIAFRDWRTLTSGTSFMEAEARDRREFMSYVGVFVSIALGVGIIWFVLPIYILTGCVRGH